MVIDISEFSKLITEVMEPIFVNDGFAPDKEAGVKIWTKQLDDYGDYRAAISYEKYAQQGRKRFTFRLYVADGSFFDQLSFRRSYIPSRSIQKKLGISKSRLGPLIGDDWLDYPRGSEADTRRALEEYANELMRHLDEFTPKAIKWLGK